MSLLHFLVFLVGLMIGFLGGLFGKGGSAIATPLLSLIGIPGFVAVAAPLPATMPGTFVASIQYWKSDLLDWQIVLWSIGVGIPATILGSYFTEFTGAKPLLVLTGFLVLGFGISFFFSSRKAGSGDKREESAPVSLPYHWRLRLSLVAAGVGFISGLLANSGGVYCWLRAMRSSSTSRSRKPSLARLPFQWSVPCRVRLSMPCWATSIGPLPHTLPPVRFRCPTSAHGSR